MKEQAGGDMVYILLADDTMIKAHPSVLFVHSPILKAQYEASCQITWHFKDFPPIIYRALIAFCYIDGVPRMNMDSYLLLKQAALKVSKKSYEKFELI